MINYLVSNLWPIPAILLARDWFLYFVKIGDEEGCQGLQKKVDDLKKKMDVDIPIKVSEHPSWPFMAHGCKFYGAGGVTVPSEEADEDKRSSDDVQNAILAHEISHIKHNDGAWGMIILLVVSAAAFVFAWNVFPPAWLYIGGWAMQVPVIVTFFGFMRWRERAADVEGCKHMTNSERQAIGDWFEKMRLKQLGARNNPDNSLFKRVFLKCLINSDGEFLLDVTHPSLRSRTEYFRSQMTSQPWRLPRLSELVPKF